jgi:hypothetical protein
MATVVKNVPGTIRTAHCRATARGQWVQELIIDCSCLRVIDLGVTVDAAAVAPVYIKVYDTRLTATVNIASADITIFPTILCAPGNTVSWEVNTEWTPINNNLIICASSTQTTFNLIALPILDIYVRYSTKEMTYGLESNLIEKEE